MLAIGLISGTSRDGVDAALVEFADGGVNVISTHAHSYPPALAEKLDGLVVDPQNASLDALGQLHSWIGDEFAVAAATLMDDAATHAVEVIGSHGQTVRHQPDGEHPFSLQIGDAARIAARTGVTTVADFRSGDLALGGQGAPLVPPFHAAVFANPGTRTAIVNIGGIANVTLIDEDGAVTGFDTGPGNTLMDAWIRSQQGKPFDESGAWAARGNANASLLDAMLADDYFAKAPPKSTGFEMFNLDWLSGFEGAAGADMQATLLELTSASIAADLLRFAPAEVLVCGGGVHNAALMDSLQVRLGHVPVASTATRGVDPDWIEACAFAWLAVQRVRGLPGNDMAVTGAHGAASLGAIYLPGA